MRNRADFVYSRIYRGPVKGLVLDWSGTTADAYVLAPAVVFVEVFRKHGVEVSMSEARGPMGLRKDLHIKVMTEDQTIRERWRESHGTYPGQGDVERMYADFVPMQLDCLRQYTTLLPGVAETTQVFQKQGIKIGSTTGFVRSMVDLLEEDARKQGYVPDASVAGDEVLNGVRPKPCHHTSPRRVAKRQLIVGPVKPHPACCQVINVRCLRNQITVTAQCRRQIVDGNKKDIGFIGSPTCRTDTKK